MRDADSTASALTFTNNYLRIGIANEFGNGVRVANDLRVNEALRVDGDVNLQDCRICINFQNRDGGAQSHACVQMRAGSQSGFQRFQQGEVDNGDEFELVFLCDGGNNSTNTSVVSP